MLKKRLQKRKERAAKKGSTPKKRGRIPNEQKEQLKRLKEFKEDHDQAVKVMTRMQRFGYQVREDVAKEGLVFGRMLDNKEQMQMEYMRHECMDIVAANDAEHIEIK